MISTLTQLFSLRLRNYICPVFSLRLFLGLVDRVFFGTGSIFEPVFWTIVGFISLCTSHFFDWQKKWSLQVIKLFNRENCWQKTHRFTITSNHLRKGVGNTEQVVYKCRFRANILWTSKMDHIYYIIRVLPPVLCYSFLDFKLNTREFVRFWNSEKKVIYFEMKLDEINLIKKLNFMGRRKVKIYNWLWRIFLQKTGLFYLFYFLKYLSLKLWPLIMHHPLLLPVINGITITFSNSKYNCFHFPSNNSNGNCVTA